MQDVFQILGIFFSLSERSKRCLRTPGSRPAHTFRTFELMSSGPLALLVLVLMSCHLTWLVLITGMPCGMTEDRLLSSLGTWEVGLVRVGGRERERVRGEEGGSGREGGG